MKVALDLDGVISKRGRPNYLPFWVMEVVLFVFRWVLIFLPENKELVSFLKIMSLKGETKLVIVSARPTFCKKVTEYWLREKGIPFSVVHCIGLRSSKQHVLKKEAVCFFVDDEQKHVEDAIAGGFDAIIMDDVC